MTDNGLRKFKVNPKNILGFEAKDSRATLTQLALTSPSKYLALRACILQGVVYQFTDQIYNTVYSALDTATKQDGTTKLILDSDSGATDELKKDEVLKNWSPKIPENEIADIALSVCKSLADVIEAQVVDRILPAELSKLSYERQVATTKLAYATE